jgi:hypothetical protein
MTARGSGADTQAARRAFGKVGFGEPGNEATRRARLALSEKEPDAAAAITNKARKSKSRK